jgi:hypothetical protein
MLYSISYCRLPIVRVQNEHRGAIELRARIEPT